MTVDVETRDDFETRADAGEGDRGLVRLWLSALATAEKEEESWRKEAETVVKRYRQEEAEYTTAYAADAFNILYAGVETIVPALYNSIPKPDIRRRFGDDDEPAKLSAQIIERCLSYLIDSYDFDHVMEQSVKDTELVGRAVARVRYLPIQGRNEAGEDDAVGYDLTCEHVPWANFRHGPGRVWADVQWVAFEHFYTRDQLTGLSPKVGGKIKLDVQESEHDSTDASHPPPEVFMRARVWEIWDKEKRQVVFLAPSYGDGPLRVEEDPLGLQGFFPIPRPLYAIGTTDTLVPIPPYRMYRSQARELDLVTRRIMKLVQCLKWRGVRDGSIKEFENLADAIDGDFVPMHDTAALYAQAGGIDKAIWLMPIDKLILVIRELSVHREEIKQVIFEITGVADIMRGQTDPNETKGAQQMKVQWGSLRVQRRQAEVARYARDIFRIKSEIIAEKFSDDMLRSMSGVKLPKQLEKQVAQQQMQMQQQRQQMMQQRPPMPGGQPMPPMNGMRPQPPAAPQGAY
jgi:hypothetical protein